MLEVTKSDLQHSPRKVEAEFLMQFSRKYKGLIQGVEELLIE